MSDTTPTPTKTYRETRYAQGNGFGKLTPIATRVFEQPADAPLPASPQWIEEVDPGTPLHDWQPV